MSWFFAFEFLPYCIHHQPLSKRNIILVINPQASATSSLTVTAALHGVIAV